MRWECFRGTGSGEADHFIEKGGGGETGYDKSKINNCCRPPRGEFEGDIFSLDGLMRLTIW